MKLLGKIIYLISFPVILLIIRNSHRVYGAILYQNKLLVTKNWLGLHNDWRLPGGGLKKAEPELAGLIREIKEEVGITINANQLSLLIPTKKHKKNYYYSVFVCQLNTMPTINTNNLEILEAKFIDINNLKVNKNSSESLKTTINSLIKSKIGSN